METPSIDSHLKEKWLKYVVLYPSKECGCMMHGCLAGTEVPRRLSAYIAPHRSEGLALSSGRLNRLDWKLSGTRLEITPIFLKATNQKYPRANTLRGLRVGIGRTVRYWPQ